MRRILGLILGITIGTLVIYGAYQVAKNFTQDRESAFSNLPPYQRTVTSSQYPEKREVKTYTAEELEELRKKGQTPKNQPYIPPAPNNTADAAVQRSLRTLEEINRINEMNQKMQEQQRRMQEKH